MSDISYSPGHFPQRMPRGLIDMTAAVREEIVDALTMGLEVTIPEFSQNVNGWQATAYIAIRPETGAGAYIVSGGLRGGDEGSECALEPSTDPAKTSDFGPAVLFAAAIIAMYLIASIAPEIVIVGLAVAAISQSVAAAPAPQLPPRLEAIWNRVSGSKPWPIQFNWPPPYGTPPLLDGTCTAEQHEALKLAQKAACDIPLVKDGCKGDMACELLQSKQAAIEQCIDARRKVMDTCFLGGDAGHWQKVQDLLGQIKNCEKCLSIQEAKQCRKPSQ